jgi:membrane protease YdiL (CAAX protease family)
MRRIVLLLAFAAAAWLAPVVEARNSIDHLAAFHHGSARAIPFASARPVDDTAVPSTHPSEPDRAVATTYPVAVYIAALAPVAMVVIYRNRWHQLRPRTKANHPPPIALLALAAAMYLAQGVGGGLAIALASIDTGAIDPSTDPEAALRAGAIVQAGAYVLAVPMLVVAWMTLDRARRREEGEQFRCAFARALLVGAGAFLVVYPMVVAASLLGQFIQVWLFGGDPSAIAHDQLDLMLRADSAVLKWAMIGLVTIGAPIVEETIYRGLIQEGLTRALQRPWVAIVATSLLFTAAHAGVVPADARFALVSLFVLSLGLGWIAERTRSLTAPVALHAAFNAINVVLAMWVTG